MTTMYEKENSQLWQGSEHLNLRAIANMPDAPEPPPLRLPYASLPTPTERTWNFVPIDTTGCWRMSFERTCSDAECGRT
jgi:hypothetical protein